MGGGLLLRFSYFFFNSFRYFLLSTPPAGGSTSKQRVVKYTSGREKIEVLSRDIVYYDGRVCPVRASRGRDVRRDGWSFIPLLYITFVIIVLLLGIPPRTAK